MVDGFRGDTGAFTLTVTCPSPPPPPQTTPIEISCGVPTLESIDGRPDSVVIRGSGYSSQGPDVSFIFNASVTGDYTFSTCIGTDLFTNTLIEVFDLNTTKSVGFDDDSCGRLFGPSSLTINSLKAVSCQWLR